MAQGTPQVAAGTLSDQHPRLDVGQALQWWRRIAVTTRGILPGWRCDKVWPDFVAKGGEKDGKPSVLVFETKGEYLKGNDDTEYKERQFAGLPRPSVT